VVMVLFLRHRRRLCVGPLSVMRLQSPGLWVGRYGDSSGRGGVPEIQGRVDGRETKKNARGKKKGVRSGE